MRTSFVPAAALSLLAAGAARASPDPQSLPQHHHPHPQPRHARKFGHGDAPHPHNAVADVVANHTLHKRGGYNGRATYFAPGLGACGTYSSGGESIVALNHEQYGNGCSGISDYCFKTIEIQYGDKTQYAKVVDCCPGCGWGGLDMSPSLFSHFADSSVGVFYMSWWVAGEGGGDSGGGGGGGSSGGDDGGDDGGYHPPTTSSKPPPSTSSSHATTSATSSAASSAAAAPSPAPDLGFWPLKGGNLDRMNQVVMALGNLVAQVAVQAAPPSS